MTRAYLRLDPGYDERKSDYPDGPYAALIACLCLAESQPDRGRFRSLRYLKALLDKRGRHVDYLIERGDLVLFPDGRLYIDGWDEWQEGDWKVTERVRRIRGRKHGDVTPDVTVGVTPRVTFPTDSLRNPAPSEVHSGAEHSAASHRSAPETPPLDDEAQAEQLAKLGASMAEAGIASMMNGAGGSMHRRVKAVTDEELVERYRGIRDDDEQPEWKRIAASEQVKLMEAT